MCDHFDVPPIKNLQTIPKFFAREPPALFSCTVGIANIMCFEILFSQTHLDRNEGIDRTLLKNIFYFFATTDGILT